MIVPESRYWNVGIGREIGEVEKDEDLVVSLHSGRIEVIVTDSHR